VRLDIKAIASAPTGHDGCVTERAAQLGNLGLQGVLVRGACLRIPEVLDQAVGANSDSSVQGKPDEHLGGFAGRHRDAFAVATKLDRAKN